MSPKRSGVIAAAVVVGVLGRPEAALAGSQSFLNYCTAGAVRTCASVQVETFWNGTKNFVTLRIRNLQGTDARDNTMGSLITKVGLTAPTIVGATGLSVAATGTATNVGNAGSRWGIQGSPGQGNIGGLVSFGAGTQNNRGGILGCSTSNANPSSYFRTCGDGGWVVFTFTTTNQWDASAAEVAWKTVAVNNPAAEGYNLTSIECRTADQRGSSHYCDAQVVPEPVTMLLLGTGLAGVGGAGALRRRLRGREVIDG